jgi:Ser/Thr protein kinase RdoA (MazF antagonist)
MEKIRRSAIQVRYSTPEPEALLREVVSLYEIGAPRRIRFMRRGLNDTYRIDSERGSYALRLYRTWRTLDDVRYELAWLQHLAAKGAARARAGRDAGRKRALLGADARRRAAGRAISMSRARAPFSGCFVRSRLRRCARRGSRSL